MQNLGEKTTSLGMIDNHLVDQASLWRRRHVPKSYHVHCKDQAYAHVKQGTAMYIVATPVRPLHDGNTDSMPLLGSCMSVMHVSQIKRLQAGC